MGKYTVYTTREVEKILKKNGWLKDRTKGDHSQYKKDGVHGMITVTKKVNPMVFRRMIKEYSLDVAL